MRRPLYFALSYIKGYCEKHRRCQDCIFGDLDECPFIHVPADWDIDEMLRMKKGDDES